MSFSLQLSLNIVLGLSFINRYIKHTHAQTDYQIHYLILDPFNVNVNKKKHDLLINERIIICRIEYRQLSADIKMKNFKIKANFVNHVRAKGSSYQNWYKF